MTEQQEEWEEWQHGPEHRQFRRYRVRSSDKWIVKQQVLDLEYLRELEAGFATQARRIAELEAENQRLRAALRDEVTTCAAAGCQDVAPYWTSYDNEYWCGAHKPEKGWRLFDSVAAIAALLSPASKEEQG